MPPPGTGGLEDGEHAELQQEPGPAAPSAIHPQVGTSSTQQRQQESDPVTLLFAGALFAQSLATPRYASRANGLTRLHTGPATRTPRFVPPTAEHRHSRRTATGSHGGMGDHAAPTGRGARPRNEVGLRGAVEEEDTDEEGSGPTGP